MTSDSSDYPSVFGALFGRAGFSRKGFARAVNVAGRELSGFTLSYTHTHVGEWLRGVVPRYPEVVAIVLSDAWNIKLAPEAIWPSLMAGRPLEPSPHATPWIAALTASELHHLTGCDTMFDRRDLLKMYSVTTGTALMEPLTAWLAVAPFGMPPGAEGGPGQVNLDTVGDLETSAKVLVRCNLEFGGQLFRRAAVDELRGALHLIKEARYSEAVGQRLLSATAYLANITGCMCLDSGLPALAQRYLIGGLKLAHEAGDRLLGANIAANLAELLRDAAHPSDGMSLANVALRLAEDADAPAGILARLECLRATVMADLNRPTATRRAVDRSLDLIADDAQNEELPYWALLSSEAEIHSLSGSAYRRLLKVDAEHYADRAQEHTRAALTLRGQASKLVRSNLFDTIGLARVQFARGEPDLAVEQSLAALKALGTVKSTRALCRLASLDSAASRYPAHDGVRFVRQRIHQVGATSAASAGS